MTGQQSSAKSLTKLTFDDNSGRERPNTTNDADRMVAIVRAMRPHQWAKNSLVFVPPLLAGKIFDWSSLSATALAFIAFSLVASSVYLINDIFDLAHDREHWTKRHRPLASGLLQISHAVVLSLSLLVLGAAVGISSGTTVFICLLAYVVAGVTYSLWLKRIALVDGLTLAGLYTTRLLVGAIASGAMLSPWLMTVSMFFFLSLSLAKRFTELQRTAQKERTTVSGRAYFTVDMPIVLSLGCGSLLASIIVFVLYLTQEAFVVAHLAHPKILWVFPLGMFLIGGRLWLLSGRGELDDDPVAFLVKDLESLAVLGALTVAFAVAWIGW
jgi:4-hydroxybenzoate polyprenyltransferase